MPLTGRCHCRRNVFEIEGALPPVLTRCACSFCSKRGHLFAYYSPEQVRVLQADVYARRTVREPATLKKMRKLQPTSHLAMTAAVGHRLNYCATR